MKHRRAIQGFSLLESAIVLGVAGAILGGVWASMNSGQENARIQQSTAQLIVLNKNIRSYYQSRACITTTGTLNPALLAGTKPAIPQDMITAGAVMSPWSRAVTIMGGGSAGCDTAASFQYSIIYTGLPAESCTTLAIRAAGSGEVSRGLMQMTIGGTKLDALPPAPSQVIPLCAVAGGNNLALTYKLRISE